MPCTYDAKGVAAGHAGNLVQRHRAFRIERDERVSALETRHSNPMLTRYEARITDLVVGRHLLYFLADERRLPLGSHDDAVLGPLEVLEVDRLRAVTRSLHGSLAGHACEHLSVK